MAIWQYSNITNAYVTILQYDNMGLWQYEDMTIWQNDDMKILQ